MISASSKGRTSRSLGIRRPQGRSDQRHVHRKASVSGDHNHHDMACISGYVPYRLLKHTHIYNMYILLRSS